MHYHSKGFCFDKCGLKSSCVTLPPQVDEKYHEWQPQHRRAWCPWYYIERMSLPQLVPNIGQFPDLPSAERAKCSPVLMLRGNCKLPSNPMPSFLSVGASPCVPNHHFFCNQKKLSLRLIQWSSIVFNVSLPLTVLKINSLLRNLGNPLSRVRWHTIFKYKTDAFT